MSYSAFADCYDLLTDNVNYKGYARRVHAMIRLFNPDCVSIAEIACGTASLSIELEKLGYDVTGTDLSEEMLLQAERKIITEGSGIVLFRQDMRELSLAKKFDAAVCSLDALNHLPCFEDVKKTFSSVKKHLVKGGLFIFDMNTPYKHRRILKDNTFFYDKGEVYAVWQNEFRESDCSVKIDLDLFFKKNDGFERHHESFRETAYPKGRILSALKSCGFETLAMFDELKTAPPTAVTQRIMYVCRRK